MNIDYRSFTSKPNPFLVAIAGTSIWWHLFGESVQRITMVSNDFDNSTQKLIFREPMGTQWSNKRSLSAAPRHLDSLEEFQPGLKFAYCTHETRHHRTQKENFPQGVRWILSCCIVCLGPRKLEALQCCNEKDILACQIYSTAITTYQNMFLVWLSGLKKSNKHPQKLLAALFEVALMEACHHHPRPSSLSEHRF